MAAVIDDLSAPSGAPASSSGSPRRAKGLPPAIILDGRANALSIARSLGRMGIAVTALGEPDSPARHSRFVRWIRIPESAELAEAWTDFLLGPQSDHLRGAALIVAGDVGLEVLLAHADALAERFRLDLFDPAAQECMLNKLSTYRAAVEAGVPTPRFWLAGSVEAVLDLRNALVFPLLVKPTLSHVFEQQFGVKHFTAENFDELVETLRAVGDGDSEIMLVEKIPGPDDRLCSYYTYLDEDGAPQFDFTKRIIRRYPLVQGNACYHVTDHNPEIRETALQLFRQVGLRGFANVEFKRDDRDGRLKLIECNARFTASDCLMARAGINMARFVYKRIVGLPPEPIQSYRAGMRLWYPIDDFQAFLALRRRGELTFRQWLASIVHPQTFPLFQFDDPLPTLIDEWQRAKRIVQSLASKLRRAGPSEDPPCLRS